jgi:hypothetical protein
MTIFKYHYGAQITVATDDRGAFSVDIGGDGIDEVPVYEIANRIEETISTLSEKFPDAAFNVGLNFGFTGSGIGDPEDVPYADESDNLFGLSKPLPPGTYEACITEASTNAAGSTTLSFRVNDFDAKSANIIKSMMGNPFPFSLSGAVAHYPIPDDEKTPEDILKDHDRQRREKMADEFDARNRTARDAMAAIEPTPKGYYDYRLSAANEIETAARLMSETTGAPYDRCVALVLNMIRTEGAYGR